MPELLKIGFTWLKTNIFKFQILIQYWNLQILKREKSDDAINKHMHIFYFHRILQLRQK